MTVNSVDYTFSVLNLKVVVHTYTGTDKIAEQLVDGSWRQRSDGFHVEVVFNAHMQIIETVDHEAIRDGMEALYNFGSGTIDLDPDDDAGNKTLTIVAQNGETINRVDHRLNIRNNPVDFSLITENVLINIPQWIMDEISAYPYEGTDTEILVIADKGITQAAGLVTNWTDQSAAGNDLMSASALTAATDSFGQGVTPKLGALTAYVRTAGNQPLSAMSGDSAVGRIWMVIRHIADTSPGDTILDITDTAGTNWTSIDIVAGIATIKDSDGSSLAATTDLDDKDAHLIEIEIDLANDTVKIYIDGTLEGTDASWTGDISGTLSATHYIQIGGDTAKRDAAFVTYVPFAMIDSATPDSSRITAIRRYCAKRFGIINLLSD